MLRLKRWRCYGQQSNKVIEKCFNLFGSIVFLHVRYFRMGCGQCGHCDSVIFCRFLGYVLLVRPCIGTTTCPQIQWFAYQIYRLSTVVNYSQDRRIFINILQWLYSIDYWLINIVYLQHWPSLNIIDHETRRSLFWLWLAPGDSRWLHWDFLRPRKLAAAAATLKIVRRVDPADPADPGFRHVKALLKLNEVIIWYNLSEKLFDLFNEISWKHMKPDMYKERTRETTEFRQLRLFGLNITEQHRAIPEPAWAILDFWATQSSV